MSDIEIRDNRQKEWFWLDNEYLNGYARHLGVSCTAVYISLCRHSDNATQMCYPSMKLIAEENGISRDTVMRALKKLEEWGIILVKKSKKDDGTQANNVYTLLAKSNWKDKPSSKVRHGQAESQIEPQPSSKNTHSRVAPQGYNNTHINNTHITSKAEALHQVIPEVIKAMESIDIKNKLFYGNKTQRQACEFLVENYGLDKVLQMIQIISENMDKIFNAPTTPTQLRDNWVRIVTQEAYKTAERNKKKPQVLHADY